MFYPQVKPVESYPHHYATIKAINEEKTKFVAAFACYLDVNHRAPADVHIYTSLSEVNPHHIIIYFPITIELDNTDPTQPRIELLNPLEKLTQYLKEIEEQLGRNLSSEEIRKITEEVNLQMPIAIQPLNQEITQQPSPDEPSLWEDAFMGTYLLGRFLVKVVILAGKLVIEYTPIVWGEVKGFVSDLFPLQNTDDQESALPDEYTLDRREIPVES
jgi:hypothetical protein